ncbi:MAG: LysR family transcriptional regulator [Succinivibrionaceae bacterium]|nr:LysR family transcriptional regulator [Succinivibrionaceae bacterium]
MDLKVLRYFMAMVREEGISAAAQALHVTQPTLSRQLKDLEDELGGPLFVRGHRGSKPQLTSRGLKLRARAAEILDLAERAQVEISGYGEELRGQVVIGCGESEVLRPLGRIIRALRELHPGVTFRIQSAAAEQVSADLDRGLIDFGVYIGAVDLGKYEFLRLPHDDTWGVLANTGDPLARRESLSPQDLRGVPLLCSSQPRLARTFEPWLGYGLGELCIIGWYNLVTNAAFLCEEGLGAVLTLSGLVNTAGRPLGFIPLCPTLRSPTFIAWKRFQFLGPLQALVVRELELLCKADPGTA